MVSSNSYAMSDQFAGRGHKLRHSFCLRCRANVPSTISGWREGAVWKKPILCEQLFPEAPPEGVRASCSLPDR